MKEGRSAIIFKKKESRQKKTDFKNADYNKAEKYKHSFVTSMKARATSQAVCGWILTTDVGVRSHTTIYESCRDSCGTGKGFSHSASASPLKYHCIISQYSYLIHLPPTRYDFSN
jgi:hypothetical protein